ncbi:MAG: MotA/TolQ/ExbB proton channel family protein [Verrucomicrobia bacterium]|nr:MotA/TolQ/ExbB proton channel family protein [Verrucomicrobiota bacterium]MCH8528237.1 MotA/TolQ/ExbB proton channel family protein [Kiritimatiellia bacterium]
MMKKLGLIVLMGVLTFSTGISLAQDAAANEAGQLAAPAGGGSAPGSATFVDVVQGGGFLGIILWIAIFVTSVAGIALIVDAFITVRGVKIMPPTLVKDVQAAMEQGDVMKALQHCEEEPCPVASVLSAGFSNVEEGFDTIQDAVSVAAAMEEERLMQRVNYLNVVGNLAPMLGLLGTVQGMIAAFANLAGAGAAAGGALALSISQALYTTAFGLFIAIPALAFFYYFRNRASTIILNMERLTMDEIKILRNVEVVDA